LGSGGGKPKICNKFPKPNSEPGPNRTCQVAEFGGSSQLFD
jgi:hypothetical protein